MSLQSMLEKRARSFLNKTAFQPMPGGQPPMDPNAQPPMGGAPGGMPPQGGQPPMDPSQMGGAPGGMPPPGMDPSMMGGMPGGMGMPMDPSMMAQAATIGSLSITDFQAVMTDMLTNILQQIVPSLIDEIKAASGAGAVPAAAGVDPSGIAPQDDSRGISNTEISQKLDALLSLLGEGAAAGGAPGMGPETGAPMAGGPEMGFGGQSMGAPAAGPAGPAASAPPGMEVNAGVRPSKRNGLADIILRKTAQVRR